MWHSRLWFLLCAFQVPAARPFAAEDRKRDAARWPLCAAASRDNGYLFARWWWDRAIVCSRCSWVLVCLSTRAPVCVCVWLCVVVCGGVRWCAAGHDCTCVCVLALRSCANARVCACVCACVCVCAVFARLCPSWLPWLCHETLGRGEPMWLSMRKHVYAHTRNRARVTSMGGLYDTTTLCAL